MRDTPYAREIATASITFNDGSEGRLERHYRKDIKEETIRFSWWNQGRILPRQLDTSEDQLITLIERGIDAAVFTDKFLSDLGELLDKRQATQAAQADHVE